MRNKAQKVTLLGGLLAFVIISNIIWYQSTIPIANPNPEPSADILDLIAVATYEPGRPENNPEFPIIDAYAVSLIKFYEPCFEGVEEIVSLETPNTNSRYQAVYAMCDQNLDDELVRESDMGILINDFVIPGLQDRNLNQLNFATLRYEAMVESLEAME